MTNTPNPTTVQWIDDKTGKIITKATILKHGDTIVAVTKQKGEDKPDCLLGQKIATAKCIREYYKRERTRTKTKYAKANIEICNLVTALSRAKEKLLGVAINAEFNIYDEHYEAVSWEVEHLTEMLRLAKEYRGQLADEIVLYNYEMDKQTKIIIEASNSAGK